MKRSIKACIAYIAGAAISGKNDFSLYDCGKDTRVYITGSVEKGKADIQHTKKGFHITGKLSDLRDSTHGIRIELEIDGNKFKGKEKASGTKFKGKLRDDHISLTADGYSSYRIE